MPHRHGICQFYTCTMKRIAFWLAWVGFTWAWAPVGWAQTQAPADRLAELTTQLAQNPSSDRYYERGYTHMSLGMYAHAEQDFQAGLAAKDQKLDKNLFHGALAQAAYFRGDYAAAERYASEGLALSNRYSYPYRFRSLARYQLGQYADALADAQAYQQLAPQDEYASYLVAGCLFQLKQPEAALTAIDRALAAKPTDTYYLQRKLVILEGLGRSTEVAALAQQLGASAPDDPLALSNLALVFQNSGDAETGERFHAKAFALHEKMSSQRDYLPKAQANQVQLYVNRADGYFATAKYEQARFDYQYAAALKPDDGIIYAKLGQACTFSGHYELARFAYAKCFELLPRYPDGWVNYGYSLGQLGLRVDAVDTYTRALALPEVASRGLLLNNRGFSYLELKMYDEAYADLTNAIATDPQEVMSHISLGEYYAMRHEYDLALGKLNEALAMPNRGARHLFVGHYRRGLVYAALGKRDEAIADLKAAQAVDPAYGDTYLALAELYLGAEEHCLGLKALQQASEITHYLDERPAQDALYQRLFTLNQRYAAKCK